MSEPEFIPCDSGPRDPRGNRFYTWLVRGGWDLFDKALVKAGASKVYVREYQQRNTQIKRVRFSAYDAEEKEITERVIDAFCPS